MRTPLLIYTEYKPFQSIFDFLLCPFECSYPSNLYARCVYHCDNNVVDHQIVNMLFENNITAQLTFTAFFDRCMREIVIHCTLEEIRSNMEFVSLLLRVSERVRG